MAEEKTDRLYYCHKRKYYADRTCCTCAYFSYKICIRHVVN